MTERERLLVDFLLREIVRIGHTCQILVSVISENGREIPLDKEKLTNRLLLLLDSSINLAKEVFEPNDIIRVEAEILDTYQIISEEVHGNQGETQQAE